MEPAVSRTTDILVVGSGMAGLMAAIVASGQGKRVTLLSRGCGSLNIGSGCVDVLGYVNGQPVEGQPLEALDSLPERHPYRLVGKEGVEEALKTLCAVSARHGAPLEAAANGNRRVPTILGTLKPTCLTLPSCRGELLEEAQRTAFVLTPDREAALRDCLSFLRQLQKQLAPHLPRWILYRLGTTEQTLNLFFTGDRKYILYIQYDRDGSPSLCAASREMPEQLRHALWSKETPTILTSGTLMDAGVHLSQPVVQLA